MLEKSEERIKMLRSGFDQKQIENLYLKENKLKIVNPCVLFEPVDIDDINESNDMKTPINCEAAVEYAQYLCTEVANFCDITKFSCITSKSKTI